MTEQFKKIKLDDNISLSTLSVDGTTILISNNLNYKFNIDKLPTDSKVLLEFDAIEKFSKLAGWRSSLSIKINNKIIDSPSYIINKSNSFKIKDGRSGEWFKSNKISLLYASSFDETINNSTSNYFVNVSFPYKYILDITKLIVNGENIVDFIHFSDNSELTLLLRDISCGIVPKDINNVNEFYKLKENNQEDSWLYVKDIDEFWNISTSPDKNNRDLKLKVSLSGGVRNQADFSGYFGLETKEDGSLDDTLSESISIADIMYNCTGIWRENLHLTFPGLIHFTCNHINRPIIGNSFRNSLLNPFISTNEIKNNNAKLLINNHKKQINDLNSLLIISQVNNFETYLLYGYQSIFYNRIYKISLPILTSIVKNADSVILKKYGSVTYRNIFELMFKSNKIKEAVDLYLDTNILLNKTEVINKFNTLISQFNFTFSPDILLNENTNSYPIYTELSNGIIELTKFTLLVVLLSSNTLQEAINKIENNTEEIIKQYYTGGINYYGLYVPTKIVNFILGKNKSKEIITNWWNRIFGNKLTKAAQLVVVGKADFLPTPVIQFLTDKDKLSSFVTIHIKPNSIEEGFFSYPNITNIFENIDTPWKAWGWDKNVIMLEATNEAPVYPQSGNLLMDFIGLVVIFWGLTTAAAKAAAAKAAASQAVAVSNQAIATALTQNSTLISNAFSTSFGAVSGGAMAGSIVTTQITAWAASTMTTSLITQALTSIAATQVIKQQSSTKPESKQQTTQQTSNIETSNPEVTNTSNIQTTQTTSTQITTAPEVPTTEVQIGTTTPTISTPVQTIKPTFSSVQDAVNYMQESMNSITNIVSGPSGLTGEAITNVISQTAAGLTSGIIEGLASIGIELTSRISEVSINDAINEAIGNRNSILDSIQGTITEVATQVGGTILLGAISGEAEQTQDVSSIQNQVIDSINQRDSLITKLVNDCDALFVIKREHDKMLIMSNYGFQIDNNELSNIANQENQAAQIIGKLVSYIVSVDDKIISAINSYSLPIEFEKFNFDNFIKSYNDAHEKWKDEFKKQLLGIEEDNKQDQENTDSKASIGFDSFLKYSLIGLSVFGFYKIIERNKNGKQSELN